MTNQTTSEMLTVCAWCKHVTKDGNAVRESTPEEYKQASHGICWECAESVLKEEVEQ